MTAIEEKAEDLMQEILSCGMDRHIVARALNSVHREGYQQAINDAADLVDSVPVDGETIREQLSVAN
jgi:hypothetical protein